MSVKHIGLVLDHLDCPAPLKLVAIILADHADSDGLCWPSYRKIAQRANMHERSVQRHIKELQNRGVITKIRTGTIVKDGEKVTRVSNAYRVNAHILIKMAAKLSTDDLGINDSIVYLESDTSVANRSTPVSTKPSMNHQSNRQHCGNVDNLDNPISLTEILTQAMGNAS